MDGEPKGIPEDSLAGKLDKIAKHPVSRRAALGLLAAEVAAGVAEKTGHTLPFISTSPRPQEVTSVPDIPAPLTLATPAVSSEPTQEDVLRKEKEGLQLLHKQKCDEILSVRLGPPNLKADQRITRANKEGEYKAFVESINDRPELDNETKLDHLYKSLLGIQADDGHRTDILLDIADIRLPSFRQSLTQSELAMWVQMVKDASFDGRPEAKDKKLIELSMLHATEAYLNLIPLMSTLQKIKPEKYRSYTYEKQIILPRMLLVTPGTLDEVNYREIRRGVDIGGESAMDALQGDSAFERKQALTKLCRNESQATDQTIIPEYVIGSMKSPTDSSGGAIWMGFMPDSALIVEDDLDAAITACDKSELKHYTQKGLYHPVKAMMAAGLYFARSDICNFVTVNEETTSRIRNWNKGDPEESGQLIAREKDYRSRFMPFIESLLSHK